jgi:hypothetical protein
MNTHEFTLNQLCNTLRLAIKGNFISYGSYFILKTPGNHDAVKALQAFFSGGAIWEQNSTLRALHPAGPLNCDQNDEKLIEQTKAFIIKYNAASKFPIDEYVWADVCKQTFQNASLFSYDSLSALASWNIFLQQLRDMQAALKINSASKEENPYIKLDEEEVQSAWITFLSQLYINGHHRTVEVIHNYLHLACLIAKHRLPEEVKRSDPQSKDKMPMLDVIAEPRNNALTIKDISLLMNVPLVDGMEIAGKIIIGVETADAIKADFVFMAAVLRIFLKMPHSIFAEPYHSSEYRKLKFTQDNFQAEYSGLRRMMWDQLPLLNVPFRAMAAQNEEPSANDIEEQLNDLSIASAIDQQYESGKDKSRSKTAIPFLNIFKSDKKETKDLDSLRRDSPPAASIPPKKSSPKGGDAISPVRPQRQPSPKERSEIVARNELVRQSSSGNIKQGGTRVSFGRTASDRHMAPSSLSSSPPSFQVPTVALLPKHHSQDMDQSDPRRYVPAYLVGFVPMGGAVADPNQTPRTIILHTPPVDITGHDGQNVEKTAEDKLDRRNRKGN